MGEIEAVDFLTLATASASLVVSAMLALWGLGRQKRFHTFEIVSAAHGRLHRLSRRLAEMKRKGRFEVTEVLELVREADEVFATVDPYLRLSRVSGFRQAAARVEPGENVQDAFNDGAMERWLEIGSQRIRRYLRIA